MIPPHHRRLVRRECEPRIERESSPVSSRPYLVDTTLRDGEQMPRVAFTVEQKVAIARELAAVGIAELEVGTPAMGSVETEAIRAIGELHLPCRLTGWCRATEEDLAMARDCGLQAVHLSLPGSPILIETLGKSTSWVLDRIETLVASASRSFDFVSLGLQDATRTPMSFLLDCAQAARNSGVRRFRLADTVGRLTPMATARWIRTVQSAVEDLPLGFHAHNDLGMAAANALTALESGATSVDVTVGGIGERAGNAALEQVVLANLHSLGDSRESACIAGLDPTRLCRLSSMVSRYACVEFEPHRPVVGSRIFHHESGIHVDAMERDRRAYELFAPQMIGREDRRVLVGKHSSTRALRKRLIELGIDLTRSQAAKLLPDVRRKATEKKDALSDGELVNLYRECFTGGSACPTENGRCGLDPFPPAPKGKDSPNAPALPAARSF